jgi:HD-GYP domain-containing protein (c-di-GMP phosphodiesterase class II)
LIAFVNALSSTAAVALNTQRLIDEQKNLLESFIQLIAGAIDAKSPYTGGHCQRVPELTKMLARAACEAKEGPFRDFSLSEDEWEAVHIGAWLHDCGKVTTPEFVVDKATKLETLYDRIHEIRMRFEVLKRDAELAYWQGIAAGGEHLALQELLEQQLRQLDDDFAFVAQCNEGGEFMAPERVERMQALAQRSWRRTLSDRIGISQDEGARKRLMEEPALPVMEPLLADRPDHVFVRSERDKLADDNLWGFKVKVPEHLYNRGELYNLCIGRGTLAEEERYKINEHMIQTIIMLDKLPFPQHLQAVPEIAGGHHEKMDGTGYPKRLKREEMSIPARMMAIADIFEALTAGDRPYKKAKSLAEALKIMSFMRKDQHIDPELFALFLQSGVYRQYAERYMAAELIDEVNIQDYL